MFKSIQIIPVCVLAIAASSVFARENDLFSSVRGSSVYEDGSVTTATPAAPTRITNAESLRDALNAAGFESKVAGGRLVTLSKELNPWTFPVLLMVSEDEQNIAIMMGLRKIEDPSALSSAILLKMMAASQKDAPFTFVYTADRKRLELYTVAKNRNLTGFELRDTINQMAIVAKRNADVWTASETENAGKTAEKPVPTAPETPPSAVTNLLGRWSAAKSNTEAFAVEFKADGTFNLVYIKSGNQTKSSGKFTADGGQLKLNGSTGLTLTGTLEVTSVTEFKFTPTNGTVLTFAKAK